MKVNLSLGKLASFSLAMVMMVGLVASANAQKILFDLGDRTGRFPQCQCAESRSEWTLLE